MVGRTLCEAIDRPMSNHDPGLIEDGGRTLAAVSGRSASMAEERVTANPAPTSATTNRLRIVIHPSSDRRHQFRRIGSRSVLRYDLAGKHATDRGGIHALLFEEKLDQLLHGGAPFREDPLGALVAGLDDLADLGVN